MARLLTALISSIAFLRMTLCAPQARSHVNTTAHGFLLPRLLDQAAQSSVDSRPGTQTIKLPSIPIMPAICNPRAPSEDCLRIMGNTNGVIRYASDSECSDDQKSQIERAYFDAMVLIYTVIDYKDGFDDTESLRYWMGPDGIDEKLSKRIYDNIARALSLRSTSNKEYITLSCKDSSNVCGKKVGDGKAVGGYATNYKGWFGYWYYYITFCAPFFTLEDLETQVREARLDSNKAKNMVYLRHLGQFFLHELMHTRMVWDPEPEIVDLNVGDTRFQAYGPFQVRRLAIAQTGQNRGAAAASRNADSYAMFANSVYFKKATHVFPAAPQDVRSTTQPQLVFPRIDVPEQNSFSTASVDARLDQACANILQSSKDE